MNKTLTAIVVLGIITLALFVANTGDDVTRATPRDSEQTTTTLISEVTIIDEEAVYVTVTNGEQREIAQFVPFEENNFTEVRSYQSYKISPNQQFVAIDGRAFEEGITQVYDVETDTLHEVIYGQIIGWTNDGLLQIEACDLSGEQCTNKISVSAETPWLVEEILRN